MSGFHGILLLRDWAEAFGPLNPEQQTNSFSEPCVSWRLDSFTHSV